MGFAAKRHPELQAFFDKPWNSATDHDYRGWLWFTTDGEEVLMFGRTCTKCGKRDPLPGIARFDHTPCPGRKDDESTHSNS